MLQKLFLKELFKKSRSYRRFIGNKIADKIILVGKTKKEEKKENKTNEIEKIYISPEKKKQFIDALRWF